MNYYSIMKWLADGNYFDSRCQSFKRELHKMVKHTQTICDHFVRLAVKGLSQLTLGCAFFILIILQEFRTGKFDKTAYILYISKHFYRYYSTAILNPGDIFRRWCKLNFGLLRDHVKSHHITAILLKDRRKETIFLLFIHISCNNWLVTILKNHLRY